MITPQDRNIQKAIARVRSPLTAIRGFCVTCMGGYTSLIETCPSTKCPLHLYRRGRNPNAKLRGKPFEIVKSGPLDLANSESEGSIINDLPGGEKAA